MHDINEAVNEIEQALRVNQFASVAGGNPVDLHDADFQSDAADWQVRRIIRPRGGAAFGSGYHHRENDASLDLRSNGSGLEGAVSRGCGSLLQQGGRLGALWLGERFGRVELGRTALLT